MQTLRPIYFLVVSIFSVSLFAAFPFNAVSELVDKSEKTISSSKDFSAVEKAVQDLRKKLDQIKTPNTGYESQYKMLLQQSMALVDTKKIKAGKCDEVRSELYAQFSPHKRSLQEAPEYLAPAIRILEASCSKVKK